MEEIHAKVDLRKLKIHTMKGTIPLNPKANFLSFEPFLLASYLEIQQTSALVQYLLQKGCTRLQRANKRLVLVPRKVQCPW